MYKIKGVAELARKLRLMQYVPNKRRYNSENALAFYDITDFISKKGTDMNFGVV